jgi:predicted ester cyclase
MFVANKKVIQAFMDDVLNEGRLERANDLVKEDFVELDPLPGQEQGREGLKAIVHALRVAFPDMHWVQKEMVAEDQKVVTRFV